MLNDPIVRNPTVREHITIRLLIAVGILCTINFCYFFFQPEFIGHPVLYALLASVIIYGVIRDLGMWYHYLKISVPETPVVTRTFTVDVLTTFYPGEPYDMIVNTLNAIQRITYPHTTYLCDEADDPYLREVCAELGVIHCTRTNRIDAKAGNINNALRQATGEICLILDPDHIPQPDFLDYIVPHFQNPEIGFVQTVQAYYNKLDTLVAKGSAQQTFHFYGPMMMTMNSYGTVNAIGANCTFRRTALDSIGGHAPGLAEDMHTAMLLYNAGWKSVYVPRILAEGLVPSTITAYFKQQIKWSRGTFDLFFKVYPRIFSSLTWRQRLHYAMMPLHYLAGIFYFIGFLIPILSLFLSDTPWIGDFGDFILLITPVLFSSFVVRFYIQRWLISDDERGFHIVGGILEILTWWIFSIGFIYTLINKKVPYLPTPKNDEDVTHPTLLIPNLLVGIVSLIAVVYGLYRDLTPFSLIMAGFALVNAFFMFFSVYLAFGVTNRNRVLRSRLPKLALGVGRRARNGLLWSLDAMTFTVRKFAPVLLLGVIFSAVALLHHYDKLSFDLVEPDSSSLAMAPTTKLGLFYPSDEYGLSDISLVGRMEEELSFHTNIISSYFAWHPTDEPPYLLSHLNDIGRHGSIPMITWEPWVSTFPISDTYAGLRHDKKALHYIAAGVFDDYIRSVAHNMHDFGHPVYLRFAHEFDNPAYPWSPAGGNTPEDFILAWRHVHDIFERVGAKNVRWIWNPWKATAMADYFPGEEYVDYIGLTTLNYGSLNSSGPEELKAIYTPFREAAAELPVKKVILAEFGSLGTQAEKVRWMVDAQDEMIRHYPEIVAVVAFNNAFDRNIPRPNRDRLRYLDWTTDAPPLFREYDRRVVAAMEAISLDSITVPALATTPRVPLPDHRIRAVGYKKGNGWSQAAYILSRKNIEADYARMQALGFNAIRVTDPGLYAHNLLSIAPEYGLEVIYNFWIPESLDFVKDTVQLADLAGSILDQVGTFSGETGIISWNFGNDVLTRLARFHQQPELKVQQLAYLNWLTGLIGAIKRTNDQRPVVLTVTAVPGVNVLFSDFHLPELGADAIGLAVGPAVPPEQLQSIIDHQSIPVVINEISAENLAGLPESLGGTYSVVTNWQNEWDNQKVSFDGLVDFGGRMKPDFLALRNRWQNRYDTSGLPVISILPPARPPYSGSSFRYLATINEGGEWALAEAAEHTYTFEWMLVKQDQYGNPLALKWIGEGPHVDLDIPEDYKRYELRLTVTDGTYSRSARSALVPQLYPAGSAETGRPRIQ